jgi:hypothetical protein
MLLLLLPRGAGAGPAPASDPLTRLLDPFDGRLVFDVQNRVRVELRENNVDFDSTSNAPTDDGWLLQRFRIGLRYRPVEWLTFYAQGQDSREAFSDRVDIPGSYGADGDDAFDLRQAWVEIGGGACPFSVTLGRQALSYGDRRLIGTGDWTNLGRTFDAVKLRYAAARWALDGFVATAVTFDRGSFNPSDLANMTETGRNQVFSGLYFTTTAIGPQTTDLYALHLHEDWTGDCVPSPQGPSDFFTFGARVDSAEGALGGWDYNAEAAFQVGEARGLDLAAFAAHAEVGYTFAAPWKPRLMVEYNYASGDGDPADGEIGTFQNLFHLNHLFFGNMDLFAWQNMQNAAAVVTLEPAAGWVLKCEYRLNGLADTADYWYRASCAAARPISAGADPFLGQEIDVTLTWKAGRHFTWQAGYSHFFAGSYLQQTGAHDDADFAYVQLNVVY